MTCAHVQVGTQQVDRARASVVALVRETSCVAPASLGADLQHAYRQAPGPRGGIAEDEQREVVAALVQQPARPLTRSQRSSPSAASKGITRLRNAYRDDIAA